MDNYSRRFIESVARSTRSALELIVFVNVKLLHADLAVFVLVILVEYIIQNFLIEDVFAWFPVFFVLQFQMFFHLKTKKPSCHTDNKQKDGR